MIHILPKWRQPALENIQRCCRTHGQETARDCRPVDCAVVAAQSPNLASLPCPAPIKVQAAQPASRDGSLVGSMPCVLLLCVRIPR